MSDADQRIRGCAIVLLGSFNPPIFQPGWFAKQELIEDEVAMDAEEVHVDADSSFFTTSEFGCEVTRDRLRFFSMPTTERFEALGDLAANAFGVLYHTPVGGISMLSFMHVPSKERTWADFAPRLAASSEWSDILGGDTQLDRIVIRRRLDGSPSGFLGLAAEPSRIKEGGVYLSLTHQYTLENDAAKHAELASWLLRDRWQASIDEGDNVIERALQA